MSWSGPTTDDANSIYMYRRIVESSSRGVRSCYAHMREQIRRDHAFLDLRRDFLINEDKVYFFEPEMVSMNFKLSVLLAEAISGSKTIIPVTSNRSRLPNFFLHCHFRVLAAGSRARGGARRVFTVL